MIDIYFGDARICNAVPADSFISRLRGLMFKKCLEKDKGLLIEYSKRLRSRSVHGFFMRFPLDLIFIDDDKRIVELASLRPWKIYNPRADCRWVLEVNEGFTREKGLKIGDTLAFITLKK